MVWREEGEVQSGFMLGDLGEGPQWAILRYSGFPLFEARDSGFESKIEARFGLESLRGRWDAKNNPRDYGIARNLKSGLPD